ncbi:hypothetical protein A9200_00310 [Maribacter hydrothermalis]|uniref:Uncharacterized protein n=1 Tax=Maribacter hydrothermalis TaxID=1836467 RepID=A0A1B7ZE79_9FLAO|nr:hypothetical protein BTR34_08665 [Maribacter hydrothermalis]OBR41867.1 hypothetical protein A9200_00310 [Maribacter hydrothermalis]
MFLLVGTTSFFLHQFFLGNTAVNFIPLLQKAYIFHFFFSLVLLIFFQIFCEVDKIFQQLGFIYMGVLVFKIIVFTAIFYPQLLGENMLSRYYRASLLIPVIVFLPLEVIFISKLMQSKKA